MHATVELENTAIPPEQEVWPCATRLAFRCAFLVGGLYFFLTVSSYFEDFYKPLSNVLELPMHLAAQWAGVHLFHLTGDAATWHVTGSSDTALDYVEALLLIVFGVVGMLVWTVVDERRGGRNEYRTAYAWLRLLLRFLLAFTLLLYGFVKIFPAQMQAPSLLTLTETYGESSPMHLLWTFLGASRGYEAFGGFMEATAGMLLLFRRTSTIGALAAAGVLMNVFAMNLFYDVCVKLFSAELLLIALFLLLPDVGPLWTFFVQRKPAMLTGVWVRQRERPALRIGAHVLQGFVIAVFVGIAFLSGFTGQAGPHQKPSLYGIWTADTMQGLDGNLRWSTFLVDTPTLAAVVYADGLREPAAVKIDENQHTIDFQKFKQPSRLHWRVDATGVLILNGVLAGNPVTVQLHKKEPDTFLLQSRGFHWVQEQAFNR